MPVMNRLTITRHTRTLEIDSSVAVAVDAHQDLDPETLATIEKLAQAITELVVEKKLLVELIQIGPLSQIHPTKKW